MKPYAEPLGMLIGGGIGSQLKRLPNMYGSYVTDMLRYPVIAPYEMVRGNYVFGSKTKAMLKRAQQESKYFNTVYDDLTDKYINKDVYPGFGDVKSKFKMNKAMNKAMNSEIGAYYDPSTNTVIFPMFNNRDTRIAIPFDVYRKGTISHEATHAFHWRANTYNGKFGRGTGAHTNNGTATNSMEPLSMFTSSRYEMNPVLRNIPVYRTHYDNIENMKTYPELKKWMSDPEEWFAEYNNIVSRLNKGSAIPVSKLTRDQKDIVLNYFTNRFGTNGKQSQQAIDMIDDYQRNFLQGAKVDVNITKPDAISLMNMMTPPPQPTKMTYYDQKK